MRAEQVARSFLLMMTLIQSGAVAGGMTPRWQGSGSVTRGGRGGAIIQVTTLADGGAGSLRQCLEASGPRICIFRVGGVIRFTSKRPIIRNPYLTVAGETAPGGGILLTHQGGSDALTPLVIKDTHDVIIRNLRVRTDRRGAIRGSNSAVTIENASRVLLDHISTSWSLDENVGLQGQNDAIVIQNSIFAEGVLHHSKCALLASDPKGPQWLRFAGNLCVSNGDRNPNINFRPGSCVEIVNNVFYNAKVEFTEIWESNGGSPVSIVGNYYRAGPDTSSAAHALVRQTVKSNGRSKVFAQGNIFDRVAPETPNFAPLRVPRPPCPLSIQPKPAKQIFGEVLNRSGAWPRDAVDQRLVLEVIQRRGQIPTTPGRITPLVEAPPYTDTDRDGMSDMWEEKNGLDPHHNDAWKIQKGRETTNLERFLEGRQAELIGR